MITVVVGALAGCSDFTPVGPETDPVAAELVEVSADVPEDATTDGDLPEEQVSQSETTEPEAAKPQTGGETTASLGDPTRAGLWLETPIVSSETQGRVRVKTTGREVDVTLIPIPGEVTAGSRLSVEAMRALGVGLADLVELDVSITG